jgi:phosphoribosylformylglycinamidine cyclo-ligase
MIQKESGTDWKEMYKVFNMGHRLEIYIEENFASEIISIAKSFNIDAKIIGSVEQAKGKKLTVSSEFGTYLF